MKIGNWNLERVLPSQRRCSSIRAQLSKIDADIWSRHPITHLPSFVSDTARCTAACINHICVSESPGLRVGETIRWPKNGKTDRRLSDHVGVAVELSL